MRSAGRVTSVDLAQTLGIAQSTVSRALSNDTRIAVKTREKVQALALELGYTPNAFARSLSTQQSKLIGIVMSEMTSPFYPFVLEKLTSQLHDLGWRVLLFSTDSDHDVDDLLPLVLEYQCDGLIIASANLSSHMSETLIRHGTPVVLFNRYASDASSSAVCCDNRGGGRLVADYLLSLDHGRYAYIAGRENTSTNRDRELGFTARLEMAGFGVQRETGNFTYEAGFAAMGRLLSGSDAPDAVFCANDITAIGAIDAARELGVQVGQQVSVIGFDDIPMAAWSAYKLTTVRQPVAAMIDSSLEILIGAIENHVLGSNLRFIPGSLIERGSVGKGAEGRAQRAERRGQRAEREGEKPMSDANESAVQVGSSDKDSGTGSSLTHFVTRASETELLERSQIMVHGRDLSTFSDPAVPGARRQSLRGFDDDYTDIVDYIIRCTHKIWEQKSIGLIYTHYSHNCPIYMTDATIYGREAVVEGTLKTLAAFPDARLHGDEVIWSGNDVDGFHSSHRITWTARNTGYSAYGAPTNKRILRRGIAHCVVLENRIIEEWLVRDELALVRQLGFNEIELAKRMARVDAIRNASSPVQVGVHEIDRLEGQLPPKLPSRSSSDGFDVEDFVQSLFQEIWNWRLLNRVHTYYTASPTAFVSTARKLEGISAYQHFVLTLLAAFPDAGVSVDHICWIGSGSNVKIAVRWILQGTHLGPGWYGDPTGQRVKLMCISHLELEAGRIAREYTVYDEFALLKQIHAPAPGEL